MIIQFLDVPFSSMSLCTTKILFFLFAAGYYLPVRANDESFIRFFVYLSTWFLGKLSWLWSIAYISKFSFPLFLRNQSGAWRWWSLVIVGRKKSVGCENLYISSNGKGIIFSFIYIIKPSSALEDVLDVARLVCLFFRARTDKTAHERVFVGEDVPRDILTFIVSFSCHIYILFLMPNHFLCYSSKGNIAYEFII
jgi:hypothetical protein